MSTAQRLGCGRCDAFWLQVKMQGKPKFCVASLEAVTDGILAGGSDGVHVQGKPPGLVCLRLTLGGSSQGGRLCYFKGAPWESSRGLVRRRKGQKEETTTTLTKI